MLGFSLLASALLFAPSDAHLAMETARSLVEGFTPRDAGTIAGRVAANCILDRASAAGADVRRDVFRAPTPKGEREFVNLYAEFKSNDPDARWVIVISHYDTKSGVKCPGANDGASTAGLLVGLANSVADWDTRKGNLLLIWADGEECMNSYAENDGFWGSKRAVEYVQTKNYSVQAVICVDMLGDKDLHIIVPKNGSPALAKIALHAAKRAGFPDLVTLSDEVVKDDHVPFMEKGYKAIDLIDFSYGPANAYWHTPNDNLDNISQESLLKSGKLLVEMLNILL